MYLLRKVKPKNLQSSCYKLISRFSSLFHNRTMSAVLVVHGGAWAIPDELAEASVDGVKTAARKGFVVLRNGGSALDAVEAAVKSLEDNTVFNAGKR